MAAYSQDTRSAKIETPLGKDKLLLRSFAGAERISTLFEYEVQLQSTDYEIDHTQIIGKEVTITIDNPKSEGGTRYINGIIRTFGQVSTTEDLASYAAIIVPKLWLTTLTRDSRIFQKKSVKDILSEIIKTDAGITDYRDSASSAGTTRRDYCVQYRETDYAFISRLMEEEGIYYYFEHTQGKHTLVLCDGPNAHKTAPKAATIPFRSETAASDDQAITAWIARHDVLPGQYVIADYNFTTPATVLRSTSTITRNHTADDAEIFDYPGYFATTSAGDSLAKIRITAQQARHITYTADTTAPGLVTGSKFKLTHHPSSPLNQEYLIIENQFAVQNPSYIDDDSSAPPTLLSRLLLIPASQEYRPPQTTPRPDLRGPHTAVVVGAEKDEIHTDKYASVKVKFHWDREGKNDENASIFIRVAQMWAGKAWGTLFIPRVGQEVIVQFLEGHPDRPLITGCVYNETNSTPYALPDHKTRTTLRTHSFESEGYNEIRFEDKKEAEQLYIHASKDHETRVVNDQTNWVGNDRHHIVINDQLDQVHKDHHETIGGNHNLAIGIGAPEVDDGKGNKKGKVEEGGGQSIKIAGPRKIEIGGKSSLNVKDDVAEKFEKNHATAITEDRYLKAKNIILEAEENVTIKVGSTFIAMTSDGIKLKTSGDIVLEAANITQKAQQNWKTEATSNAELKGTAGVKIESSANLEAKAGAQLKMEGTAGAELKGSATLKLEGGAMAQLKAGGILTIQGAMVNIN